MPPNSLSDLVVIYRSDFNNIF